MRQHLVHDKIRVDGVRVDLALGLATLVVMLSCNTASDPIRPDSSTDISLSKSSVSVSDSVVSSGSQVTATVRVRGDNGANVVASGLHVSLTSDGGTSTVTIGEMQDHGDGTYSALVTGVKAG